MAHHPHRHGSADGHHHAREADEGRVLWAMIITLGLMAAEVEGGLISGSLTLLADAAHMLTDGIALGLAWTAFRIARRDADKRRTFGFHRLQIIVALVNGLALFVIAFMISLEAFERFREPVEVTGGMVLVVGILGLAVNLVSFRLLSAGDPHNLNLRGAALHVLGDLLGSAAVILAALVIMSTGWLAIDPILAVAVSLIVLRSAFRLVKEAGHVLMEGTPDWIDIPSIKEDLKRSVADVQSVHHVHAWMITPERPMITLHAKVGTSVDINEVNWAIHDRLKSRFGLDHATVQLEPI